MKNEKILFLNLYTFSLTGGIEKVCQNFLQVLEVFKKNYPLKKYYSLSLHDTINKENHEGHQGKKISFGLAVFKQSFTADIIILSHIHLLIFGRIIKAFYPKKRIILFAHGIEIWKPLAAWKKAFLSHIEIWAVSHYTADVLKTIHQLQIQNIKVLNNCLPQHFDYDRPAASNSQFRQKHGVNEGAQIVLTICRLSSTEKYKGYDQILLALKDIIQIIPNLKYFIAGQADEPEQKRILQLIGEYKLQAHVSLTGYVPEAEIRDFYQVASIFAMPSKGEGFGLVFLEAVANGCQVLAGNSDGSRDALLNGELGLLVNPEDHDAVYHGLLQLLEKPVSREVMNERQQKLKKHFGFERYVEKVEELIFVEPTHPSSRPQRKDIGAMAGRASNIEPNTMNEKQINGF